LETRSSSTWRSRTSNNTVSIAPRTRVQLHEATQALAPIPSLARPEPSPQHRPGSRRSQVGTVLVLGVLGAMALWARHPAELTRSLTPVPRAVPVTRSQPGPAPGPTPRRMEPSPEATPVPYRLPYIPPPVLTGLPLEPGTPADPPPPPRLPPEYTPAPLPAIVPSPHPAIVPLSQPGPQSQTQPGTPVDFRVSTIAGDGQRRSAVLEFEGQTYLVEPGTKVPDSYAPLFDVKEIQENSVTVFDRRTNRMVSKLLGF
jgi:hypothetical protein